ncbi:PTS system N-acetylglucosamine-specific EIICB component [Usitatibacter rugosus]|uniref:PTS system N-acetylglucosamine-specific EIICB component n=1 Tax=Usitatibacter rugosus TaxID=2732067 RepID=A0A6M4GXU4_9PROT|nr:N-acetylglucosamine-specific PTS transporter subunit IIBC [Usitatibacter rugosus]QJR11835.1 PTS system N-acetylglucosamine-specific EIICB component [Usitatibacter rugosus]
MMKAFLEWIQGLGRALMLPIAVLPIAGLLLRLGQPDLLNIAFVAAAGDAVFANLGILFAIGVAVGLAKENHGAAGLAGAVAYFISTHGTAAVAGLPAKEIARLSVPLGIICGVVSGALYNRYSNIKLPDYLAFFGGRRFVPIAAGTAALGIAVVFGIAWPVLVAGMDSLTRAVVEAGSLGLFIYGVLNRVLIVTGLHHILNNVAWFILGEFAGKTGDLNRFFAGDPTAGAFMSGFFPVMMFGLPAACLAMYHTARPERKRATGGLLLSMGLTSFLTGVTEPIEFTFMFLAPFLYLVHAILTGLAMVTMDLLGTRLGFSFSAGFFDYVLNYGKATHPLYLIPVGALYFGLYYGLFRYFIVKLDLKTPGREPLEAATSATKSSRTAGGAEGFVIALGGAANLESVDACTTRLRLVLVDRSKVNEPALKTLGARGMIAVGPNGLQVVVGPIADQVASDIRAWLAGGETSTVLDAGSVLEALGGRANVLEADAKPGRVLVTVKDGAAVKADALQGVGLRGVARFAAGRLHLLHPDAAALAAALAGRDQR